jgi:hypothetical protein
MLLKTPRSVTPCFVVFCNKFTGETRDSVFKQIIDFHSERGASTLLRTLSIRPEQEIVVILDYWHFNEKLQRPRSTVNYCC